MHKKAESTVVLVKARKANRRTAVQIGELSIEQFAHPKHKHLKLALIDYANSKQTAENVNFLLDVYEIEQALQAEHLKTGLAIVEIEKQKKYQDEFNRVFDTYIPTIAASQINISQTLRATLEREKSANAFTMCNFKITYEEIKIITADLLKSFQSTLQFKSLLYFTTGEGGSDHKQLVEAHSIGEHSHRRADSHGVTRATTLTIALHATNMATATTAATTTAAAASVVAVPPATATASASANGAPLTHNSTFSTKTGAEHLRLYNMRFTRTHGPNASSPALLRLPSQDKSHPSNLYLTTALETDRTVQPTPGGTPQSHPLTGPIQSDQYKQSFVTLLGHLSAFLLVNQKYKKEDATCTCFGYKSKSSNERLVFLQISTLATECESAILNWNDALIGPLQDTLSQSLEILKKIVGENEPPIMGLIRACQRKDSITKTPFTLG
jgi:acetolactate synthase small subunit